MNADATLDQDGETLLIEVINPGLVQVPSGETMEIRCGFLDPTNWTIHGWKNRATMVVNIGHKLL